MRVTRGLVLPANQAPARCFGDRECNLRRHRCSHPGTSDHEACAPKWQRTDKAEFSSNAALADPCRALTMTPISQYELGGGRPPVGFFRRACNCRKYSGARLAISFPHFRMHDDHRPPPPGTTLFLEAGLGPTLSCRQNWKRRPCCRSPCT